MGPLHHVTWFVMHQLNTRNKWVTVETYGPYTEQEASEKSQLLNGSDSYGKEWRAVPWGVDSIK